MSEVDRNCKNLPLFHSQKHSDNNSEELIVFGLIQATFREFFIVRKMNFYRIVKIVKNTQEQ